MAQTDLEHFFVLSVDELADIHQEKVFDPISFSVMLEFIPDDPLFLDVPWFTRRKDCKYGENKVTIQ